MDKQQHCPGRSHALPGHLKPAAEWRENSSYTCTDWKRFILKSEFYNYLHKSHIFSAGTPPGLAMPDDPEQIKLLGSNAGPAEVPMKTRILTNNFYYTKDVNLPKPFSLLVSPFCPKILCLNHPLLCNVNTLGSLTKKVSLSQPFLPSFPPSLRKGFTF